MQSYKLTLSLVTSLLLLTACSSSNSALVPDAAPGVVTTSAFNSNPQQIATQASTTTAGDQTDVVTQLQAARELIKQQHYDLAASLLNQIDPSQASTDNVAQQQILYAQISLAQQQAGAALQKLNSITNVDQLSTPVQINYFNLRAAALLQLGQLIGSIKAHIQLQPLLTDDAQTAKQNAEITWQQLQKLSAADLQSLSQSPDTVLAGWGKLTLAVQQNYNDASALLSALQQWQQQYPQHPASLFLPASLDNIATQNGKAAQVAILLPLQGPYAAQAEAVLNGFLAESRQLPKTQQPVIRVYDTGASNSDVKDTYEQAISDGAQFVVGPLIKPNVQAIVDHGCSVPTLLLNYSNSDDKLPAQCFEFAMSPINEASQAAARAWSDQDEHAMIISPQGDWGQPIAASFQNRWQSLGGSIVGELDFDSNSALTQQIAALMGIQQSTQRQQALQRLLGQNVKFLPRRRADVGVIFVNATNAQARQIVPLLKFNLSGSTPIFATSLVYNGVPSPSTDNDLNGVRFLIMPWSTTLNPEPQLYQQLQTLWPTNFQRNSKLYALGIDSFKLMQNLNRMQLFSQIAIQGTTGKLTLQPNQQITQQMFWAKFVDGTPVLLKTKTAYGNN